MLNLCRSMQEKITEMEARSEELSELVGFNGVPRPELCQLFLCLGL